MRANGLNRDFMFGILAEIKIFEPAVISNHGRHHETLLAVKKSKLKDIRL